MNDVEIKLKHHPIQRHTQDLIALCNPLTTLNITAFSHIRTYKDNKFAVLSNNPEFISNYFKKKYHTADPCVQRKTELSDVGQYLIWDSIHCRGKTAMMMQDSAAFNFRHVFTIIKQHADFSEFYHFGTHVVDPAINQLYVNNLDLLDRFITFFKKSVSQSQELSLAYNHKQLFRTDPSKTTTVNQEDWPLCSHSIRSKKQQFLNAISMLTKNKLTLKEIEYARLLIQGKTAKEIAAQLGQSPRTIEHRIDLLKSKLYAKNKIDLVFKLKDLIERLPY